MVINTPSLVQPDITTDPRDGSEKSHSAPSSPTALRHNPVSTTSPRRLKCTNSTFQQPYSYFRHPTPLSVSFRLTFTPRVTVLSLWCFVTYTSGAAYRHSCGGGFRTEVVVDHTYTMDNCCCSRSPITSGECSGGLVFGLGVWVGLRIGFRHTKITHLRSHNKRIISEKKYF